MASAIGAALVAGALAVGVGADAKAWPSAKYQKDPVRFANEILGVELWSAQVEILEAIRDNARVAVCGGRKIGKDFTVAVAALWWYSSFHDARVFMTATTSRQVDGILFLEIRRLIQRAGRCVACRRADEEKVARREQPGPIPCAHSALITGRLGELARTGLKSSDFREITGFTAREAEAVAGISGAQMMCIVDEASGVDDEIHTALRGNMASGDCREVLISNPTRAKGFFFEAFHSKSDLYRRIQVSSESTPNVIAGRDVVKGLASRRWLDEQRADWGVDSPTYKIHVKGEFVLNEKGCLFSVHAIEMAEKRWHEVTGEGQLCIGIDPAGATGDGDESAFAARRGRKILSLHAKRGLTPEAHLIEALGLILRHRLIRDEVPCVIIDRDGQVGAQCYDAFRSHLREHEGDFELIGFRGSEKARRRDTYHLTRDELYAGLEDWFRDGAIPVDSKLERDLNAIRWGEPHAGRSKIISKELLRDSKELGRSPDRADAVALSVWRSSSADDPALTEATTTASTDSPDPEFAALDPYSGAGTWGRST
jgi:phage terminase large subunit